MVVTCACRQYYLAKIDELEMVVNEKTKNLARLEAQRNQLNSKVRLLREELSLLQEQGSHVGEVVKAMDKKKVLVKGLSALNPMHKNVTDLRCFSENRKQFIDTREKLFFCHFGSLYHYGSHNLGGLLWERPALSRFYGGILFTLFSKHFLRPFSH